MEKQNLDELLKSPGQEAVRDLMHHLPDDGASMQWRSALNERLLAVAPKRKRSAWSSALGLLASAGAAAAIAFVFLVQKPVATVATVSRDSEAIAATMVSEHRQSVTVAEIAGPGMSGIESDRTESTSANLDGDEAELTSL